ncbi:MAG: efflux RND transporter periplasmic adaptor subunit [Pseudomonadota bacterium]
MKRAAKWIVWLSLIGGLVAGVRYGWQRYQHGKAAAKAIKYETAKVDRGRISARITATGTLSPLKTVQVGAQVSGRILEVMVDFNSPVKRGQVVARLDPQLFNAAVQQARANHTAAQANLAKARAQAKEAERQLVRQQQLAADKLVAQADVDTAESNVEVANAQITATQGSVEQARATLEQAQLSLAYTTIYSPIDGMVISRNIDVGQTVAASFQAPTLFTIAEDLRRMQVDTSVAEGDVGRIQEGMAVAFTVDAFPSEKFAGKVRQVRNSPQTVQNVVTYNAVIDVENPELKLKPGMTANVTFILAEKDDIVRVPNAALRFRPPAEMFQRQQGTGGPPSQSRDSGAGGDRGGGNEGRERAPDRRVVFRLEDGVPKPIRLRIGITDGSYTEMVEGDLREGDLLISEAIGGSSSHFPRFGGPMGRL